jgi:hypothetical protein
VSERRDFLKRAVGVVGLAAADPLGLLLKPVEPPAPGAWLEFDEHGIPYRCSTDYTSPYYYPDAMHKLLCTVDGLMPGCCVGYDRKHGFVECRHILGTVWWKTRKGWPQVVPPTDPRRWQVVRRYGEVVVRWA